MANLGGLLLSPRREFEQAERWLRGELEASRKPRPVDVPGRGHFPGGRKTAAVLTMTQTE